MPVNRYDKLTPLAQRISRVLHAATAAHHKAKGHIPEPPTHWQQTLAIASSMGGPSLDKLAQAVADDLERNPPASVTP